jgi:hypothetical protein
MKFLKFSVLMIIVYFSSFSLSSQTLSTDAEISLITCNPGTELYSVFGHSAIRVHDPEKGIDWVYNYGTFSFDQPGFYVKFVRGFLNYQLKVDTMRDFMMEYLEQNRSVYEQVLNLNQQEKDQVFEFLEFNRLPENKYYMYDFFFDNCATRVRDVFQKELKGKIEFSKESFNNITFREMLKPYLAPQPWSRVGINLVLGAIADRPASFDESMFLPDYMKMAFDRANIITGQTKSRFVKKQTTLFEQKAIDENNPFYSSPGFVFTMLFLVIFLFTFLEMRRQTYYKLIDFIVFFVIGIIGFILFFMWFFTNHTAVVKNWNLLWAMPTHLIFAFFVFKKTKSNFLKYYFMVTGLLAFLVIPFWAILPQRFDIAFVPLILMVSLRSYQMFRYHR